MTRTQCKCGSCKFIISLIDVKDIGTVNYTPLHVCTKCCRVYTSHELHEMNIAAAKEYLKNKDEVV